MNWKEAENFAQRVGCKHALAVTLISSAGKYPDNNQPSTVVCKIKVRKGYSNDTCGKLNGSSCPLE